MTFFFYYYLLGSFIYCKFNNFNCIFTFFFFLSTLNKEIIIIIRDRSPCTVCDFVVNGLRKTCARYCIQFVVFYDRDKTSGYLFTSFVRGDFLLRWRQKEHTKMRYWFLLVMMRRKKEPLLNQNGNLLVLFSTK